MRRGLSYFQRKGGIVFEVFLLFLLGAGLSACGPAASPAVPKPILCKAQEPNANIYRAASGLAALTPDAATTNGPSGVVTGLSAEQAFALLEGTVPQGMMPVTGSPNNYLALEILVNETRRWSAVQTIELDNSGKAQIVITFLTPQMIKAVYDSEVSSRGPATLSLQSALGQIAAREELIFFVTVITNTNNTASLTSYDIELPIRSMIIMNSDDLAVAPLHDDHNLSQPIHSALEPVFGYLSYPIAMQNGTACSWILNPDYNKKIVITIPHIYVNKADKGPYTWVIPYSSLFKVGASTDVLPRIPVDPTLVSVSLTPPGLMKDLLASDGMPEQTFWQMYAGFLWRQVMMGMY